MEDIHALAARAGRAGTDRRGIAIQGVCIEQLAMMFGILYSRVSELEDASGDFRSERTEGGPEAQADDDGEDSGARGAGAGELGAAGVADGAGEPAAGAAGAVRADNIDVADLPADAGVAKSDAEAAGAAGPPAPDAAMMREEIAALSAEKAALQLEKAQLSAEIPEAASTEMMERASSMTAHQMKLLQSQWRAERAAQLLAPGSN